ncbi:ABC transporter ATP-binding protein [Mycolicibacterium vaccae]|uniref:ABC transporter ATP-binding protein n=1 Tax=Mycolicibacterium vaccae ATCC 25954 TaxID=1194972 RepID=K0UPM2_MYCVA|nr:ABC transporter ATP-binding protein [Mycolicibacterium vaccae]ANI40524.1 ABC transporter ATP-binding protein [Mycolicibacterium vaccae 95051]EJZ04483.1 ABC transporter ATP-binding protein [Mycolicibacterium vaccae ATCC 25954]
MVRRLEARNIGMTFVSRGDPNVVLRDLTFHADENEFVSFVGPSGCGKSTLFNIVAGLTEPTTGDVFVEGENTTGRASKKVGYVLQKDLLLPWRTIIDNVIIGLEVRGVSRKEAIARAEPLFESYNLTGYENALPGAISGGMRQRAALMRTLVMDPDVILMDEAYKALDYPLKIALESELLQTVRSLGKTVIFVTHDIEEAVTLSDRVYIMKARPGEIISEIAIDLQVNSTRINERRLAPRFNEYYETIWRSIGDKAMAS